MKRVWLAILWVAACAHALGAATGLNTGATESGPRGVVVNPDTNLAYAITSAEDTVTAIDGAKGIATAIKVGQGPKAIAVNQGRSSSREGSTDLQKV